MMVFLDIGSTLIEGPPVGPARRLAEQLALPPEQTRALEPVLFRTPCDTPAELAARIAGQLALPRGRVLAEVERLWQAQLEETYVLPGAREMVQSLADADLPRAYVSNIWPPFYQGFARHFPEEAKHCPCFPSFRMGLAKPDPAFYRAVLQALAVAPEEVVMVGDTYRNDIAPAAALGMRTVWVLHRPQKERTDLLRVLNGQAPAADLNLASIGDLRPPLLRSLEREPCKQAV